jgi:transposase-like protein
VPGEADIATLVIRLGVERLVPEVTDYLGREPYQRRQPDQEHRGYRNGSEPGSLHTAEGQISVQVPQVRGGPAPYRSQVMTALRGHSDVLERLAVAMDTRGLSTRDIEAAFEETTGPGARLLGRSAVSELTETLWQDFEAFSQ